MSHLIKIIILLMSLTALISAIAKDMKPDPHEQLEAVFSMDIVRHAARTPLADFKYFLNFPTYNKGKITKQGQEDSLSLGKKLRKYYLQNDNSFPINCNSNTMLIRSTHLERTSETARFILQGLCPQKKLSIISHPLGKDNVLYPLINKEHFQYRLNDVDDLSSINLLKHMGQVFEVDHFSKKDIVTISDILDYKIYNNIFYHHDILSKKDDFKYLSDKCVLSLFQNTNLSCLVARDFIKDIKSKIHRASLPNQKLQYALYLVHDINILSLLRLLQDKIPSLPPYLANIRVEVFRDKAKSLFVKMSYDNKILMPCNTPDCPIKQFISMLDSVTRSHCNFSDMP